MGSMYAWINYPYGALIPGSTPKGIVEMSTVHLYLLGIIGWLSKVEIKNINTNYGNITCNQKMSQTVAHTVSINSSNINTYNKYM